MKKKKILIVTELFPSESCEYLGSFVYNQLNYLKKYYDITIIVPRFFDLRELLFKKNTSRTSKNGFNIYYIPRTNLFLLILNRFIYINDQSIYFWNKVWSENKIYSLAKRLHKQDNFSLIIGHESGVGDAGCMVGKKLNIPSVFHLHSIFDYVKKGFGAKSMDKILLNMREANHIISVSQIAINSYIKNGLENKNISIIPNMVNPAITKLSLPIEWLEIVKDKEICYYIRFFGLYK